MSYLYLKQKLIKVEGCIICIYLSILVGNFRFGFTKPDKPSRLLFIVIKAVGVQISKYLSLYCLAYIQNDRGDGLRHLAKTR